MMYCYQYILLYILILNLIIGINHFVDVDHMIQKYDIYYPYKKALNSNKTIIPFRTKYSELRWFFYMAHDKDPYKNHFKRKVYIRIYKNIFFSIFYIFYIHERMKKKFCLGPCSISSRQIRRFSKMQSYL